MQDKDKGEDNMGLVFASTTTRPWLMRLVECSIVLGVDIRLSCVIAQASSCHFTKTASVRTNDLVSFFRLSICVNCLLALAQLTCKLCNEGCGGSTILKPAAVILIVSIRFQSERLT